MNDLASGETERGFGRLEEFGAIQELETIPIASRRSRKNIWKRFKPVKRP